MNESINKSINQPRFIQHHKL